MFVTNSNSEFQRPMKQVKTEGFKGKEESHGKQSTNGAIIDKQISLIIRCRPKNLRKKGFGTRKASMDLAKDHISDIQVWKFPVKGLSAMFLKTSSNLVYHSIWELRTFLSMGMNTLLQTHICWGYCIYPVFLTKPPQNLGRYVVHTSPFLKVKMKAHDNLIRSMGLGLWRLALRFQVFPTETTYL